VLRGGAGLFFDRTPGDSAFNTVSNPPFSQGVTLTNGLVKDLGSASAQAQAPSQLIVYDYADPHLPSTWQWNAGVQMKLPAASSLDVSYVGSHEFNVLNGSGVGANGININAVDIGAAFLPQNQDPTKAPSAVPGASALPTDLLRSIRGFGAINQQQGVFWQTYHSIQTSVQRRFSHGFQGGLAWTLSLSDTGNVGLLPRYQHAADGTYTLRDDNADYVALNGKNQAGFRRHVVKANFVWSLPTLKAENSAAMRAAAAVLNDWQLSGILTAGSGAPYTVGFAYQGGISNVNLTGSPDYPAKIRIVGDTGSGCSSNQYNQFNVQAFAGPLPGSVGLESGQNYMVGCPDHTLDLALARNFKFGRSRTVQVRLDAFNALNTVVFSSRNSTVTYDNPTSQNVKNSETLADGSVDPTRLIPQTAGFGAVTAAQAMRSMQLQIRFGF
jgi:hypothetical protein